MACLIFRKSTSRRAYIDAGSNVRWWTGRKGDDGLANRAFSVLGNVEQQSNRTTSFGQKVPESILPASGSASWFRHYRTPAKLGDRLVKLCEAFTDSQMPSVQQMTSTTKFYDEVGVTSTEEF